MKKSPNKCGSKNEQFQSCKRFFVSAEATNFVAYEPFFFLFTLYIVWWRVSIRRHRQHVAFTHCWINKNMQSRHIWDTRFYVGKNFNYKYIFSLKWFFISFYFSMRKLVTRLVIRSGCFKLTCKLKVCFVSSCFLTSNSIYSRPDSIFSSKTSEFIIN